MLHVSIPFQLWLQKYLMTSYKMLPSGILSNSYGKSPQKVRGFSHFSDGDFPPSYVTVITRGLNTMKSHQTTIFLWFSLCFPWLDVSIPFQFVKSQFPRGFRRYIWWFTSLPRPRGQARPRMKMWNHRAQPFSGSLWWADGAWERWKESLDHGRSMGVKLKLEYNP